jgi:hypothetical protein
LAAPSVLLRSSRFLLLHIGFDFSTLSFRTVDGATAVFVRLNWVPLSKCEYVQPAIKSVARAAAIVAVIV